MISITSAIQSQSSILPTTNDETYTKKNSSSSPLQSHSKKKIKMPLNEISPTKKKENHKYEIVDKKQKEEEAEKKRRTDANGVEINHKNRKKVRVTFKDKLPQEESNNNKKQNNLTEVIKIESFKEYNYVAGLSDLKDYYVKKECTCACNIY